jgi:uncharacterized heparinase superfamily protein
MAFNQICDPNDWKGPIDAIVPAMQFKVYADSVEFMTGTEAVIHERDETGRRMYDTAGNQLFRMTSVGYRAGPCGDH